jgi:ubiquinone biosynthesis protein COQ9
MIDQSTTKGRVLAAALECAAAKNWAAVSLLDIAEAANVPLTVLRGEFNSKADVLGAIVRAADDEVIARMPKRSDGQDPRDALFDVVMTRLDVLAPYKAALKSIHASGSADVSLARPYLASQNWMLQAAGIATDGAGGVLRVAGLAMVYASVFRVWLDDEDAGLAKTMAALDRRLRRGEYGVRSVERLGSAFCRIVTEGPAFIGSIMRGRPKPGTGAETRRETGQSTGP